MSPETLVHPHEIVKAVEKGDMMHAHAGGYLFGAYGIVKDCQAMVSQIEGVKSPKAIDFKNRVNVEEGVIEPLASPQTWLFSIQYDAVVWEEYQPRRGGFPLSVNFLLFVVA